MTAPKKKLDFKQTAAITVASIAAISLTMKAPFSRENSISLSRAAQAVSERDEIPSKVVEAFFRDISPRIVRAGLSGKYLDLSAEKVATNMTKEQIAVAEATLRYMLAEVNYRLVDTGPQGTWRREIASLVSNMTNEKPSDVIDYLSEMVTTIAAEQLDQQFSTQESSEPVGAGAQ